MKVKEICKQYGLDYNDFLGYVLTPANKIDYRDSITGATIEDANVSKVVAKYQEEVSILEKKRREAEEAEQRKKEEEERRRKEQEQKEKEEEQRKKKALAEMLITSGFNFDGYKITRYSGYISGDDCVTIPRNSEWIWKTNKVEDYLCDALVKIRRQAIKELKEAAYNLECNAVIGVDFDYLTLDPQHADIIDASVTVYEPYVICVTANGNAVVIEKDE